MSSNGFFVKNLGAKSELVDLERSYRETHYRRLREDRQESIESNQLHLDLVDYLQRINSYSESIALTMLEGYLDTRKKSRRSMPSS